MRPLIACGVAGRPAWTGGRRRPRDASVWGLGGRKGLRVVLDHDQRWTQVRVSLQAWYSSKDSIVTDCRLVSKGIFCLPVADLLASLGGGMANPAERGGKKSRTFRERVADLFLFLSYTPHDAPQSEGITKTRRTAAAITRGVGRIAAVTPAGEGRRERGVRLVGRASHLDARS